MEQWIDSLFPEGTREFRGSRIEVVPENRSGRGQEEDMGRFQLRKGRGFGIFLALMSVEGFAAFLKSLAALAVNMVLVLTGLDN